MSIYQIIQQVASTTGRNDKISILTKHKDNETLKRVLVAALDPFIQYHIRKIPPYTPGVQKYSLDQFIDLLNDSIVSRKVTGHAAINLLAELLSGLSEEDAKTGIMIMNKSTGAGFSEGTVNKVWKDLIPEYPCLLGKPYDDKTIKAITYPAVAQIKADGMRSNFHKVDGELSILGRSGKSINLLGFLDEVFLALHNAPSLGGVPYVFDGELVVLDANGKVLPRKKGNGILNKAIQGTISDEEVSRVRVRLWDCIPSDDFYKETYNVKYSDRIGLLRRAISETPATELYCVIETRIVTDLQEALSYYQEAIEAGQEGIMLKNANSIWENKRSKHLIKFKAEKDCDLCIVGWNYGAVGKKWEKHLGSLICESSDGKIQVNVTGLSDDLRNELFNIDSYIGKVVAIKYNERISSDKKDVDSLYLPRIEEIREDKTEANSSDEIK